MYASGQDESQHTCKLLRLTTECAREASGGRYHSVKTGGLLRGWPIHAASACPCEYGKLSGRAENSACLSETLATAHSSPAHEPPAATCYGQAGMNCARYLLDIWTWTIPTGYRADDTMSSSNWCCPRLPELLCTRYTKCDCKPPTLPSTASCQSAETVHYVGAHAF